MDCSDSRLRSGLGSGGGECASREGPRSAKATLAGPRLESRPEALRDVPLFRPGLHGLISLGFGRLRGRSGGRRFRWLSRGSPAGRARAGLVHRGVRMFLAAQVPGWCDGWDLPCSAQVPGGGPACWGPCRLRHRIPRAPEAGIVRRALTARGHGLSRCCSVTCPCAERSRRVRGSAQSPMS